MSLYNYVDTPNSNLICCICRAPFTEPTTTRTCSHTFCLDCILHALSHSALCPVDRSPLSVDDLSPAGTIVRCLVDELVVECVHKEEGCGVTAQRQMMPVHLRDECGYGEVGCPIRGCEERRRRMDMAGHVAEAHGEDEAREGSEDKAGEEEEGEETYTCPHASVGCPYRRTDAEHITTCPYEALKDYIATNTRKVALLTEQNVVLRHKVDSLESTVDTLRKEMNGVKSALGPWFRASSSGVVASSGEGSGHAGGEEGSRLVAPLDLGRTLEGTLSGLRESVVGLAVGIESVGRRGEIGLANETLRLGEEMMSVRAQMHGLRMQVHGMMMDRNASVRDDMRFGVTKL